MSDGSTFPFHSTWEAWGFFNKAAKLCFDRIIDQETVNNPDLLSKIKILKNADYCARLMYILNMFTYEGNIDSEFNLDWAMIMAKPLSASQARQSLSDLINLGLITKIKYNENIQRPKISDDTRSKNYTDTHFDFD